MRDATRSFAVTGAAGYVGSRLVKRLADNGQQVSAITRRAVPWVAGTQVELDWDASDVAARLTEAFGHVDAVVHLAGPNETADPDAVLAQTTTGSRQVAAAAATAGVQRVVYLSTMHVYGAAIRDGAVLREGTVAEPRHPYAVARLASEHLVAAQAPDPVVLRLTNSVGAPVDARVERWSLLGNDLARQAVESGRLRLATTGRQRRDFCALADVCRWLTMATDPDQVPSGTYNVGSGATTEVLEFAHLVADVAAEAGGRRPEVLAGPQGPPPVDYRVDIQRARSVGLAPTTALRDAVAEVIDACRSWYSPTRPADTRHGSAVLAHGASE